MIFQIKTKERWSSDCVYFVRAENEEEARRMVELFAAMPLTEQTTGHEIAEIKVEYVAAPVS